MFWVDRKMTTSEFITKHENRRKKPYPDTAKPPKMTIGVGWNFSDNPLPPHIAQYLKEHGEITDEMIDSLLECSISVAEDDCHDLFPDFDNFSANRKMALTDFLFQLGKTKARRFVNSIAMINTGRWEEAAEEMRKSAWAEQVPKRAKEVTDLIEAS
jgi:lysozyme